MATPMLVCILYSRKLNSGGWWGPSVARQGPTKSSSEATSICAKATVQYFLAIIFKPALHAGPQLRGLRAKPTSSNLAPLKFSELYSIIYFVVFSLFFAPQT